MTYKKTTERKIITPEGKIITTKEALIILLKEAQDIRKRM